MFCLWYIQLLWRLNAEIDFNHIDIILILDYLFLLRYADYTNTFDSETDIDEQY